MKNHPKILVALALSSCLAVSSAHAVTFSTAESEFTPGTLNQGWWPSNPLETINVDTNDNHFTGHPAGPPSNGTLRSFYTFDVSTLDGPATSATFRVQRWAQQVDVVLGFWDVTTPAAVVNFNNGSNTAIWTDLGSGNSYGSFNVATGALQDYLSFTLNSQALADINASGGFFTVGAAVASPEDGDIFAASGRDVTYLDIATSVPEPGTFAMMAMGLALLGGAARRRKLRAAD
jgi:hypothetical protein